ncbi:MAG TPA: DoxX family protein, partial [Methylophilaceae bacterium]|nr:DoxX family protein [Methylophilaceae bacterium]
MNKYLGLVARVLLAQVYLIVGLYAHVYQSMSNPVFYSGFQQYLGSVGLPGIFAPLMILIEVLGAVLLFVGYKTRFAAFLLAAYSVFIALVFHNDFGNPQELLACLQYIAVAGGMLAIANNPITACSLDNL